MLYPTKFKTDATLRTLAAVSLPPNSTPVFSNTSAIATEAKLSFVVCLSHARSSSAVFDATVAF